MPALFKFDNLSIFTRILVIFLVVNAVTSTTIIFAAGGFNRQIIERRTKENIVQQVNLIRANFEAQYVRNLDRSLRLLAESKILDDFQSVSEAEQIIVASDASHFFIKTIKRNDGHRSAGFADDRGNIKVSAEALGRVGRFVQKHRFAVSRDDP